MIGKLFKKSSKTTSRIPEYKEKSDNQIIGIWGVVLAVGKLPLQ